MAAKTKEKQPTTEGYKYVPMVAQNYAYGIDTGDGTKTLVKRLFLLPVRFALIKYFDIPYPTSTEALAPFYDAQSTAGSGRLHRTTQKHTRKTFNGFDDVSGSDSEVEGTNTGNPLKQLIKVGHQAIIKTPSRTYADSKGKTRTRSAQFYFPKELTMLQVAQAMGSLLQNATGGKYENVFQIVGHGKYPLVKHTTKGPLNGADVGCWLVTEVPSGLTVNSDSLRGDDTIESPSQLDPILPN